VILGCLPLIGPVRNAIYAINWYRYKPADFVLADLDTPGMYFQAREELLRRDSAKVLLESVREKLIEKALREQSAPTVLSRRDSFLFQYLSDAFMDGRLTQPQLDLFVDQMMLLTLTVRSVVVEGDQVSLDLLAEGRVVQPRGGWSPERFWYKQRDVELKIDDKSVPSIDYGGGRSGSSTIDFGKMYGKRYILPAGEIGKHEIETDVWTIWYGIVDDEAKSRKLATRTAKASYEVVSRDVGVEEEN